MDTLRHTENQTPDRTELDLNANEAYEAYRSDQTDENYERLYEAVLTYGVKLANLVIPKGGWQHHAALNAATSTLLELEKFDPQRASFSTWAYMSLKHDLIDWQRKRDRQRENCLTDLMDDVSAHVNPTYLLGWNNSWTDTFGAIEDKIFLRKFVSTLSDEEQSLCKQMAAGYSLSRMASTLGVSLATVKRRWDVIREKGRAARVLKG
jgi:RNA polymerase sigma factor (sigma-70 family)